MPDGPQGDEHRIPAALPILPLQEQVIYPQMVAPLQVSAGAESDLVDVALAGEKMIGLVAAKTAKSEGLLPDDLFKRGTAALILRMMKLPDESRRLLVQGIGRIELGDFAKLDPYMIAKVTPLQETEEKSEELEALRRQLLNMFREIVEQAPHLPEEAYVSALNVDSIGTLADLVAANLNLDLADRQAILEELDVGKRLRRVSELASKELEIVRIGSKIQSEAKTEIDKAQREYILRQQLKAIQKELGEGEEGEAEIEELRKRVEAAHMPEAAQAAATREVDRLSRMHPSSAEYTTARTYVDWLLDMPWSISTEDAIDLGHAQKVLDEDHFDLEKVKDRIVEYLAVRKLKADMKGPILCFVGPPGTGKTSVGRSIARAMGRKFIRISLGGVRDEAEIRGHRRTYVGALPGRIIQGIKNAGTSNPVFMLDEVDKLGADFRGDPTAALLEVLDPEQNYSFSDHYLDVPFDLSKVFFICTANILDTVPPALQDRMETLTLPGYTEEEKIHIAQQFLIPRQLDGHGLQRKHLRITKSALKAIISGYTREAGVRNLEREIGTICRKVARDVAAGKDGAVAVKPGDLHGYLGPVHFLTETALRKGQTGVVCGLAYTPAGGEILFIEATRMPGSQKVNVTGQVGDVMRESAEAALSYVRTNAARFGIPEGFFKDSDIHIHVPAGAIPKDGPSAGVAMATALVSLLTGRPARSDTAMTGEITLRGQVMPIGGVKQKTLAAHRAGIKRVILPKHNAKDLEELSEELRQSLQFTFVDRIDDALKAALEGGLPVHRKKPSRRRRAAKA
jgi:ATP-dependent Lon protease